MDSQPVNFLRFPRTQSALFLLVFFPLYVEAADQIKHLLFRKEEQLGLLENVPLEPEVQHIPEDPALADLRPPPPRLLPNNQRSIFIGTSGFRDGFRCGKTLFTAFSRASNPAQVFIGVVDQLMDEDVSCLDSYCALARNHDAWKNVTSSSTAKDACPYRENIRIDRRQASDSRGPIVARAFQQKLVQDEEFCLQIDCHSIFTNNWDTQIVADWFDADNEMAVLTTYPHDLHNFIAPNGDNNAPNALPFICGAYRGAHDLPRNKGATLLSNMYQPQLTPYYGAGIVFSKCHAETRVPIDPHALWIFDGEEFYRAAMLWTSGYDMYAPTKKGLVVYHNYTAVGHRHFSLPVEANRRQKEETQGANRVKLHVGMEFEGDVSTKEYAKYHPTSSVRSLEQFFNFSGLPFNGHSKWPTHTCVQSRWVPFTHPQDVETLLPGWRLRDQPAQSATQPGIKDDATVTESSFREQDYAELSLSETLPSWASAFTTSKEIQVAGCICIAVLLLTRKRVPRR